MIDNSIIYFNEINGKEFANHEAVAETLEIKVYFADPYSAWQRGLVSIAYWKTTRKVCCQSDNDFNLCGCIVS